MSSPDWIFSCPDWEDRLRKRQIPMDLDRHRPHLNQTRVKKGREIFGRLVLPDVPGQPKLQDSAPPWCWDWLDFAVGGLHANGDPSLPDGLVQNIRTIAVLVPKKQSKTTIGAAIMLTLAMMSPRPRADFLLLGPQERAARLAFDQLAGMVLSDPVLRELWHVRDHLSRIEHRQSGTSISVRPASMRAVTGVRCAAVLCDEAHLWSFADASRVFGQLRGGQASVPEGLLMWISTESDVPPAGLWKEESTRARAVRDGSLELPGYLPLLWEPPKEYRADLVTAADPAMWEMVTPSLGYTVSLEWLKADFKQSAAAGEQEALRWLSQHANVPVSTFRLHSDSWQGADAWPSGTTPGLSLKAVQSRGQERVVVGVDGGGLADLCAVVVLVEDASGTWWTWARAFCYPSVFERYPAIVPQLRDFEVAGDLVVLDSGEELDPIVDYILELTAELWDPAVGCDPSGIAPELAEALEARGMSREAMLAVPQGFKLRPGYQAIERKLRAGKLKHGGQPLLDWCVSNAAQDQRTGLITKGASGFGKIDALVALSTAAVAMFDRPPHIDVGSLIG